MYDETVLTSIAFFLSIIAAKGLTEILVSAARYYAEHTCVL